MTAPKARAKGAPSQSASQPASRLPSGNHGAEDQTPDAEHAAAHFVGDDGLHDRVRGGEKEEHAESAQAHETEREVEIGRERKGEERAGEKPDAGERDLTRREDMPRGGDGERTGERADAAGGHEHAVAVRAEPEDIAGESGQQDRIGPAENPDRPEQTENGADASMFDARSSTRSTRWPHSGF